MNTKKSIKNIILLIKEKLYFKGVHDMKNRNALVIVTNEIITKPDMAAYHSYYLKYKKSA